MATKTISITEETYERLMAKKNEKESFSDVINKITNKVSLLEFSGLLTSEEADALENDVKAARTLSRKRAAGSE
ncbi:MAG: antitoxin VapB family protein [Nanoarchaeota archaeon]